MRDALTSMSKLPEKCAAVMNDQAVYILRGARDPAPAIGLSTNAVDLWNQRNGVTPQQAQAMIVGVTMGWDRDGADCDEHVAALGRPDGEVGPFRYEWAGDVEVTISVVAPSEEEAHTLARARLQKLVDALYDADLNSGITYGASETLDLIETDDPR